MHVLVMGGGVVGVTAAYELLKDGHSVTLVDKNDEVGAETSWGNAGMIAPGHSFTWSSPRAPWILAKSLFMKDQALRFKPSMDPHLWSWSWKFLAECTQEKSASNTLRKHRLAIYSQSVMHETLKDVDIAFDRIDRGILYFYRHEDRLESGVAHMQILADDGQEIRVLDRAGVLRLEPALQAVADGIAGGVYCPGDETGNCPAFTQALARHCAAGGMELRTGEAITGLLASNDEILGVQTTKQTLKADAYVMALGCQSAALARQIGVALPVYPIKGYSLTIPVGDSPSPPTIGSVDEENLVAISRFGEHVRVTATAEFAGYDTSHKPEDFTFMEQVVRELYPQGAQYERAHQWAGLRPMTPTNLPVIGRKRHRNLYFDTGHGHIGWTMSHGSARIVADLVAGREPALSVQAVNN
ncbi:amino acid dehydrogenase [Burkholderia sp. WAC0059]|uniref:D-amino acid dehydrogenase n=1 Tax=Burkholderia sp. WAC0059 TaxID=2066022 RepID=UPI000C7EC2E6|nr:D-amino acid dehydrogenase [Burkholderia sp. WAC0059]PLZ00144.1 amino acid dehydrogenase [Burkholderia sp. WAC0059]